MKRYFVVTGVAGLLVSDPHVPTARRFVGMKPKVLPEDAGRMDYVDRFEPVVEAVQDHADIRNALRDGSLELIQDKILAKDAGEALAQVSSTSKKTKKDDR